MSDKDPSGLGQHESGAKLDADKPRTALVLGSFARALLEVSEVGTAGAIKYSDNGWKEVADGTERYNSALMRHWLAVCKGEMIDKNSGRSHYAHIAWNSLAVLELYLLEEEVEEAIVRWKNILQSTQKQQEQTSEEEPDLSTSQPSIQEVPQDVGVSQSIQLPEKYRFRAEKKIPSVVVSIADR